MADRSTKGTIRTARASTRQTTRSPGRPRSNGARSAGRSSSPTTKSGKPITDELAERLAREAEAGYDLSRGRRVGRRSLGGGSGRSPRLNIRTPIDLYERAVAHAAREGKSVSQLAREALEKYVR